MVTGCGTEDIAIAAMKLGIDDYVVKDIAGGYLDLLPVAIRRVLGQHRLAQQKKQAAEDLQTEKAIVDTLLEVVQDVFWVCDAEFRLIRYSRSLKSITGFRDEELRSRTIEEFHAPEDRPAIRRLIELAARQGHADFETALVTKSGAPLRCNVRATALRNSEGEVVAICGLARSTSERDGMQREHTEAPATESIENALA